MRARLSEVARRRHETTAWSRHVADEGGSAIRAWRPGTRPAILADARAGLASPEDLVRDAAGNIYFTDDDGKFVPFPFKGLGAGNKLTGTIPPSQSVELETCRYSSQYFHYLFEKVGFHYKRIPDCQNLPESKMFCGHLSD